MTIKKTILYLSLLSLSTCVIGPVHGLAGTYTVFPGEFQTSNEVAFEVEAEGCQHSILGLVAFGHAAVGYVAKENKIGRIAIVDHSTMNLWSGLYVRYCTIVVGEHRLVQKTEVKKQ